MRTAGGVKAGVADVPVVLQDVTMNCVPKKKSILLHTCCGPCATHCIEVLQPEHHIVLFYANSNIDSLAEFEKRLEQTMHLGRAYGLDVVVDPYDHAAWLAAVEGEEGEPERGRRCGICFAFNLGRAAEYAAHHGFDGFTTTLTVSPHKVSRQIFAAAKPLPGFIPYDFKKQGGFQRSLVLAARHGLYRQNYCGCEFSLQAARQRATLRDFEPEQSPPVTPG